MSSEKRKENRKNRFFKVINSDRYQYTESSIYLKNNMEDKIAVFDIFIRTKNKNDFGIVSGIDEVIELIDILNETSSKERKKYLLITNSKRYKIGNKIANFIEKFKFI